MSPRWGFGAGWVALAIDMPPLWGFWVFGLDMLCDIHCAPLERRDWKDRRSIDISLLWSERHISACWGYGSGKIPDLQQGNYKGCPYKDRPNVLEGSSSIDISLLWNERYMLPRGGYGSDKIPTYSRATTRVAPTKTDPIYWKDRRSIDISLLWNERHMLPRRGYGSSKMPDLQQGNHKGCPYKDRPNVGQAS